MTALLLELEYKDYLPESLIKRGEIVSKRIIYLLDYNKFYIIDSKYMHW